MRLLGWTILIFLIAAVIKIDLQEGTMPLTNFYEKPCTEIVEYETVQVKIRENDTIYSLLAATPSAETIPQSERLTLFFTYNPHLQNQRLIPGEEVIIPIKQINHCEK